MKRRNAGGVSLAEAVLCVALIGLLMVMVSDLLAGIRRADRLSEDKARGWELCASVLERIGNELRLASEVVEPATSAPAARVVLRRVTAANMVPLSSRLPALTIPPPPRWNPSKPTEMETVTYDVSDGNLGRRAGSEPLSVLAPVKSLQATQPRAGLFHLVLTVAERHRDRRWAIAVFKP